NYETSMAKLKKKSQERITKLQNNNQRMSESLSRVSSELNQTTAQLENAQSMIGKKEREQTELKNQLESVAQQHADQMKDMQAQFDAKVQKQRKKFEKNLAKERLSAQARAQKEAEYAAQARAQKAELEKQMAAAKAERDESLAQLKRLEDMQKARAKVAQNLQANLAKAGVKAEVDGKTGDVVIDFGEHYFETGKSSLKPQMEAILKQAMPAYSESLFKDRGLSDKISGVEVIGFASPTYKGKYVDPKSLDPKDREAVNYNLDLSYQRARSIFNYIFDTKKINFQYQKKLLPLVKVTGRSYLAEAKSNRGVAGDLSRKDFCEQYDCKKAQTVIIRFNMKD
ncbi:MAG: hypothetical protein KDD22_01855, partial [Bdellovibrionales bacterium]|nr:hypothetical protein [Bdellovibrionales bacterium]